MSKIAIHWFRQDLRLSDNPSLSYSAYNSDKVLPIYILDNININKKPGEASNWWLHQSLTSLNESLDNNLNVYKGNPLTIIKKLVKEYKVDGVYWNRCYDPDQIKRDTEIKSFLKEKNINTRSFNSSLLWDPKDIVKNDMTPFRVFTPFYKNGCLKHTPPRKPIKEVVFNQLKDKKSIDIKSLNLMPKIKWYSSLEEKWNIGEKHAQDKLKTFIRNGISDYKEGRNFPNKKNVSELSPYLHFGEISPNQIWYSINDIKEDANSDHFRSELGWREFSYNILYNNNDIMHKNIQSKFNDFPWVNNQELLNKWQQGLTGIPIVDAGMRELWQTGYMHNRVRMIVASFLVKNLLIHWKNGEEWFWDTLVDADIASNCASWQWVAGCGTDAAPYFRIFNPVTQGQKFDPEGEYTKKYVPELSKLEKKYLFNPWEANESVLDEAGLVLGKNYPEPIVCLKKSREIALAAFQKIKKEV